MSKALWLALLLICNSAAILYTQGLQQQNIAAIGGNPPAKAICDDPDKVTSANINLSAGTGDTEIVAASGTTTITVCSYVLIAGGADDVQWIVGSDGTGTCDTSETDKVTFDFTADGDGVAISGGNGGLFKTPAGGELCVERTNSVSLKGSVTYVQQQM